MYESRSRTLKWFNGPTSLHANLFPEPYKKNKTKKLASLNSSSHLEWLCWKTHQPGKAPAKLPSGALRWRWSVSLVTISAQLCPRLSCCGGRWRTVLPMVQLGRCRGRWWWCQVCRLPGGRNVCCVECWPVSLMWTTFCKPGHCSLKWEDLPSPPSGFVWIGNFGHCTS